VFEAFFPGVPEDRHKPGPVPSKGRFEHDKSVVSVGQEEGEGEGEGEMEREVFRYLGALISMSEKMFPEHVLFRMLH